MIATHVQIQGAGKQASAGAHTCGEHDAEKKTTMDPSRILIVDDEPNVRLVFRTALESAGYQVQEASDGQTALELIRRGDLSVVLLDLRMPRLDGLETLRQMREEGISVPVVVVTAHGSLPDVVAAMRLGAVDFIPKPLSPESLRRVVRDAVGVERAAVDRSAALSERLGKETLMRARQAAGQGELDEADFFLRVAVPLGADSHAVNQLADEVNELRQRRGLGKYPVTGGLTWG
jgi:CheY-like chemotaxis protein